MELMLTKANPLNLARCRDVFRGEGGALGSELVGSGETTWLRLEAICKVG